MSMQRPPLLKMPPAAALAWVRKKRAALERKMRREQAYLARRATRGTHTPTDDAYEQDQALEADLLALLDEIEAEITATYPVF